MATMKILCFGDLVGVPGQSLFMKWGRRLKEQHKADMVLVNGENAAVNGRGITPAIVTLLREHGADVITSGNHIWAQKQIYSTLTQTDRLLRPYNFPAGCPGTGVSIIPIGEHRVGVLNLQGRIFMHDHLACPFKAAESALTFLRAQTPIILVDFHAEATSEKLGMGYFLDGKVSAVFGTHTHVQTADERVLPGGTAFISDLGCCAAQNSMLGMNTDIILQRLLTQMPQKFAVEHNPPYTLHGICLTVDTTTGKATAIERIKVLDTDLRVGPLQE